MPQGNETTTKFKVDIRDLKKGIQEAQRQIRLANAEFKAASSGMDDWSKSSDGLSAKLKQLQTVLDGENKKLDSLKQQLALTEKEYGSNSKAADELRIAIANQEAVVNNTKKSIKKYEQQLADLDKENSDVEDSSKDVKEGIKDIEDAAKEAKDSLKSLGDTIAGALKKGVVALGAAVAGATTAFLASAEATREYREDMKKLQTAFETAGFSADVAKGTYKEFYKVLGEEDRSVEAVNHLAQLTKKEEELAKWTDICAGVTATFGDSLPIEGLTEAANETAKVGKVTGPLADALNWAGISEDEFNEKLAACTSEQERATLITDTLNGKYAEAAEKYKELNKDVMASRDAQSELNDKMAEVGAKAEPIMTAIKQGFADILAKILELTENVDFSAVANAISEGFGYFIDKVIPAIMKGFNFIIDNSDIIIAAIAGVGAAFVALKVVTIVQKITTAIKAWTVATEGMTLAQKLLNLAMAANPIGIVIALITGLVTAFVVLWNKSESFRKFWINLWKKIKEIVSGAVKAIGEFFSNLWEGIKNIWSTVSGWFNDYVIQPIVGFFSGLWSTVSGFFSNLWSNIVAIFKGAATWFNEKVVQPIVKFFTNLWKKIKDTAKEAWNFIVGIFKGAADWFNTTLIEPITGFFTGLWDKMKSGASAAWEGIKSVFSSVTKFFQDTFTNAWQAVKNVFSTGGKIFDGIKDGIVNAFTTVVNAIITGINKVIAVPFKSINGVLNTIRGVKIPVINVKPFSGLWSENPLPVPQIPQLYDGAVVKKGKPYLLEGKGDEAVVPLHNNKKWVAKTARELKSSLKNEGVIGNPSSQKNVTNNYNFVQNNSSPKALSRLEIYRQTKNQLLFAKGV